MKNIKALFVLLLITVAINSHAQEYFEGEIQYAISYEAINPNIPIAVLETEMGTSFTAYIKEDRYTTIYSGTGQLGWTKIITRLDQGYSYTEFEKSDTIVKSKFGSEKNELLFIEKNKAAKKIVLGTLCESVSMEYKPGDPEAFYESYKGTYYFDPRYALNSALYENYVDGFWNLYVKESGAISIRSETEFSPFFKAIQEATTIEAKKMDLSLFEPNPLKVIKEE